MKPKTGFFSLGHVYMRDPYIIHTSPRACGSAIKENFKSLKLHSAFHCASQYARHAQSTLFAPYCVAAATDCMPLCCSAALVYVCPCPLVTSSRWSGEALHMCSTRGEEGNNPLLISGRPGRLLGCGYTSLFQKQCVHNQNLHRWEHTSRPSTKFIGCNLFPPTQHKHYPLCLPLCSLITL